jgi:diadenosine tetraphosphate (Ap4A) HIT family hydrolase
MEDYSKYLVKQYKYWGVYVHSNQSYLGRCVVWCDRDDALQLTDATKEEQEELFVILNELRAAAERAFQSDWLNFSFLGNRDRHLHAHFVPRYATDREFAGAVFTDERWGHHYKKPEEHFVTSPEILEQVRLKMKECLEV